MYCHPTHANNAANKGYAYTTGFNSINFIMQSVYIATYNDYIMGLITLKLCLYFLGFQLVLTFH